MTTSQNGRAHSGAAFVPSSLDKRDSERRERYRRNLAFYNGEHWSGRTRGRERRLTFNYARAAVEKVASYLMADIRSTVPPVDSSPEEQERARRAERPARGHRRSQFPRSTGLRLGDRHGGARGRGLQDHVG